MLQLPLLEMPLRTRSYNGLTQIWDPIRKIWVVLSPEEHVRQALLYFLHHKMGYPMGLTAVERGIDLGHTTLRFDAVIFQRERTQPWMLIECKSPTVAITEAVLLQAAQYHGRLPGCRFWLLSNGRESYCADFSTGSVSWLDSLPAYEP